MSHSGQVDIEAIALDAIHHGAGTKGNTVVLRRQEIAMPDGTIEAVPFISGNSIRHMIRSSGVLFALETMGVPFESLGKPVVDLLFSGGSLGGKKALTLEKCKRVEALFPILSLLGYSAGNRPESGRLNVWNLHMICEQNSFRMPEYLRGRPGWDADCSLFTGMQFGTRHDASRAASSGRFLALADKQRLIEDVSAPKGKTKGDKSDDSTQMIYDFEVILPNASFFGGLTYTSLKDAELNALISALSYGCQGESANGYHYQVGAKASIGLGKMRWHFRGLAKQVQAPSMESSQDMLPVLVDAASERLDAYRAHLRERRDEILRELEELAQ